MKFKITKLHAKLLATKFEETDADYEEIELEPVYDTAREAILIGQERDMAYRVGYECGYERGRVDQAREERDVRMGFYRTKCSCIKHCWCR